MGHFFLGHPVDDHGKTQEGSGQYILHTIYTRNTLSRFSTTFCIGECSNSSIESIILILVRKLVVGFSFEFGTAEGLFVDGDLYRDILIPGFEDKSFSFDEEVLDILEDNFVVAVIFIDFWFFTLK